jgi:hypothetical protein
MGAHCDIFSSFYQQNMAGAKIEQPWVYPSHRSPGKKGGYLKVRDQTIRKSS